MGEDNIQLNLKYMLYKFYVSFNYIYNTYTKYIFKNQKNEVYFYLRVNIKK